MAKRLVDVFLAGVALLVTAPVGLVVAGAIWVEDRLPVLFRSRRAGLDGVPFLDHQVPDYASRVSGRESHHRVRRLACDRGWPVPPSLEDRRVTSTDKRPPRRNECGWSKARGWWISWPSTTRLGSEKLCALGWAGESGQPLQLHPWRGHADRTGFGGELSRGGSAGKARPGPGLRQQG